MSSHRPMLHFLLLTSSISSVSSFWLTTTVKEFRIREECDVFWNETGACPSALLRISTHVNGEHQFATKSWSIRDLALNDQETSSSFVSEWHHMTSSSSSSIQLRAQIETSHVLNPFGLTAKCDSGVVLPSFVFNSTSSDVWQRMQRRLFSIDSQCFQARVMLKIDDECPNCQSSSPSTLTSSESPASPKTSESSLLHYLMLLAILTFLLISLFLFTLHKFLSTKSRRRDVFIESGISSIISTSSTSIPSEFHPEDVKGDIFSVLPPKIDWNSEDITLPPLGSLETLYHQVIV